MDFKALVTAQLNANNAETELKDLCKDRNINLKVNLTGDINILKNIQNQLNSNVLNLGKQTATMYSKGIKSVKLDGFFRDTFKQNKKDLDKAQKLVNKYQNKSYAPTEAEALKAVKAKRNAEQKANAETLKQQENLRKQEEKLINDIEEKRIASIQKRQEEEKKLEKAQNDAINKELESSYKQQQKQQENLRKQEEVNRKRALDYTKNASSRLNDAINKYDYGDNAEATKLAKQLNRGLSNFGNLSDVEGDINSIEQKVSSTISSLQKSHESNLRSINEEIQAEKTLQSQRDTFSKSNLNGIDIEIKKREENAKLFSSQLKSQMEEETKFMENLSSIQDKYEDYNTRFSSLQGKDISKFANTAGYAQIEANSKEITVLQDRVSKGLEEDKDIDKINSDLKEMNSLLSKSETLYSNLSKPIGALDATLASNKTLNWLKENTKATKEFGDAFETLAQKQAQATTLGELQSYDKDYNNLVSQAKSMGLTGKSLWDESKRAFTQIAEFTGMYGIIQNVIEEIPRQILTYVADIDDAMTNLQMATGVTDAEAKELMKTYSAMGKELKALGTDVATSSTKWLKQGKSIQEANKLAEDSIILSKIGDMSSEDATKTITAAMKSYELSVDEVMGFVDQISAIDMASATDVAGLSDAFNEVAANAKVAGVETENLLSYLAVIGETSQEGMSSVGTAVNAIFSRMGNIKLSRLKDYENEGEDLSNVETVLKKNGIALRDATGQFREFDDVLTETASKWESFNSVTQRAVSNAFAGTHHANSFMILMENWGNVEEYISTATTSSGESMEKFEAYQQSLSGSIEGFKNAAQSLSNTAIDSGFLTGIVDVGTGAIEVLDGIIDNVGTLSTLLGVGGGIFAQKTGLGKIIYVVVYNTPFYKVA